MEEITQFIIAIIFISIFVFKWMGTAIRKKTPSPLPKPTSAEEFFEEMEAQPEPKIELKSRLQKPQPVPKAVNAQKEAPSLGLSINELQRGIILATILGPPKSLANQKRHMS